MVDEGMDEKARPWDGVKKIVTLYSEDPNPEQSWVKDFADRIGAEFRVEKKREPTREELKQAFSDRAGE